MIVPRGLAPPPPEREGRLWRLMGPAEADALVQRVMSQPQPPERVTVTVRQGGPVAQWDPFTGEIHRARVVSQDGQSSTVEVDLTSAPVGILVFGQEASHRRPAMPATAALALDGDWESELVQTQDNRYGDFAWPPSEGAPPVEVRRLDYLDGRLGSPDDEIGWASVLCGFAPLVEVGGPCRGRSPTAAQVGDWRPYLYSTRYGGHKTVGHHSGVGLQGMVPEQRRSSRWSGRSRRCRRGAAAARRAGGPRRGSSTRPASRHVSAASRADRGRHGAAARRPRRGGLGRRANAYPFSPDSTIPWTK